MNDEDDDAICRMRDLGELICEESGVSVYDICTCQGFTQFYTSAGNVLVPDALADDPEMPVKLQREIWATMAKDQRRRA